LCRCLREHQRQGVQFMYECVTGLVCGPLVLRVARACSLFSVLFPSFPLPIPATDSSCWPTRHLINSLCNTLTLSRTLAWGSVKSTLTAAAVSLPTRLVPRPLCLPPPPSSLFTPPRSLPFARSRYCMRGPASSSSSPPDPPRTASRQHMIGCDGGRLYPPVLIISYNTFRLHGAERLAVNGLHRLCLCLLAYMYVYVYVHVCTYI